MASGDTPRRGHSQRELLEAAHRLLACRLPPRWSVSRGELDATTGEMDLALGDGNRSDCRVLVEARSELAPRDAVALTAGLPRRLRAQIDAPLLVVAPYLSPSVRGHLRAESISYIDLTGNVRIALDNPGLFIETEGFHQDPKVPRSSRLRGKQSGAVVRLLVDVRPPYTAIEVATATNVDEGYVSRILGILLQERLIDRPRRGPVTDVDWEGVIRRRAQTVDLVNRRGSHPFAAPRNPGAVLASEALAGPCAVVTGPFAAARLTPVTSPNLLVIYTQDARGLASSLRLATAGDRPDVLLVHPEHPVVFDRVEVDDGVGYAAPSQVAIDCLASGGPMASHGVAVLEWMRANESRWRLSSIDVLFESAPLPH